MRRFQCVRVPIRPGHTDRVAGWIRSLDNRRDEVCEALEAEGIDQEIVLLEREDPEDHLLILTAAEDIAAANRAFQESTLPVDTEFRTLMAEALDVSRVRHTEVLLVAP